MSSVRTLVIGVAVAMLWMSAANAQQNYIAFHGAYVITDNPDLYTYLGDIPHSLDAGYAMGIALGHETEIGFRMELEGTYRSNPVDKINGLPASGNVAAASGMANLLYDFAVYSNPDNPYSRTNIIPYIGIGVGGAYLDFKDVTAGGVPFADEGQWVPAAQGIVGMGWRIGTDSMLSIDYRYFKTFDGDFASLSGPAFDAGYVHHTAMLSLRTPF